MNNELFKYFDINNYILKINLTRISKMDEYIEKAWNYINEMVLISND